MAKGTYSARQPWHSAADALSARHEGCRADLVWTPLLEGWAQPVGFPEGSKWALCSGAASREQVASGCCSVIQGQATRRGGGSGALLPHHPSPATCLATQGAEGEGH